MCVVIQAECVQFLCMCVVIQAECVQFVCMCVVIQPECVQFVCMCVSVRVCVHATWHAHPWNLYFNKAKSHFGLSLLFLECPKIMHSTHKPTQTSAHTRTHKHMHVLIYTCTYIAHTHTCLPAAAAPPPFVLLAVALWLPIWTSSAPESLECLTVHSECKKACQQRVCVHVCGCVCTCVCACVCVRVCACLCFRCPYCRGLTLSLWRVGAACYI
jgi:hypothetical protein